MTHAPNVSPVEAALEQLDDDVWSLVTKPGMATLTREWTDSSVDTLIVLGPSGYAMGRRDDPAGVLVWQRNGAIDDVAAALNALPAPGKPGAPSEPSSDRTGDLS